MIPSRVVGGDKLFDTFSALDYLSVAKETDRRPNLLYTVFNFSPSVGKAMRGVIYAEMKVPELPINGNPILACAIRNSYFWSAVYTSLLVMERVWGKYHENYLALENAIKTGNYIWEVVGLSTVQVSVQIAF